MRYKINDTIHRIIQYGEREKAVIDHPYFQRLRHIKQLALVYFVFPGAVHDRFSHSLGAMHMASLIAEQFFYNEEYSVLARVLSKKEKDFLTLVMRLSGLLHDIGHAPFSHATENHMPMRNTLDIPQGWFAEKPGDKQATHEDYSVLIIRTLAHEIVFGNRTYKAVLSETEAEIIASLIHKHIRIPESWHKQFSPKIHTKALHALIRSWISGDIDIDRMDYLLRDSYFTGVPYGNYDAYWLINSFGVTERKGNYITSISEAGVHSFEYYLLARYNMFTQVYFHKTVRCFEHYLKEAFSTHEIDYPIPSDLDEYVTLRDTTFFELLYRYADEHPFSWSGRLISRKPAKRVVRMWGRNSGIDTLFKNMQRDLQAKHIHPFLVISQSKFLDYEEGVYEKKNGEKTHSLFSALSMTPLLVIRKHFGIRTALNIEDSSFILKHYHQDISMGDIFIPPEEYQKAKEGIHTILKKHFKASSSEIVLGEEE
ncbi:MAG: HD domain-containing protein [bacterium]|nr:HD domain-containing protein [bacterium]